MRVITGTARGVRLTTPDGLSTRPTAERIKEALFSAIQFEIEGRSVLDLFAGSGQLGVEALSRGAESAVFVDVGKTPVACIRENLSKTKLEDRATVVQSDYLSYLGICRRKFGLIFLDPPYDGKMLETALDKIIAFDILSSGGIIVAERPAGKDLDAQYQGYVRSRDYRYGKTLVAIYRKE
ncbi:MAG: 16S rRNA (guanine(966)-N(2))-methyltransferase RsmD [Oscillospiraceae bacterium]|nr:16S rRNA (guanine(966)-N(2))-methyltransferase RsmD [Oscillospiraceae bacterium]